MRRLPRCTGGVSLPSQVRFAGGTQTGVRPSGPWLQSVSLAGMVDILSPAVGSSDYQRDYEDRGHWLNCTWVRVRHRKGSRESYGGLWCPPFAPIFLDRSRNPTGSAGISASLSGVGTVDPWLREDRNELLIFG